MTALPSAPEDAFDEALHLLTRDRADSARPLLERVIEASRASGQSVLLTRALYVLGELLVKEGAAGQAKTVLDEALLVSKSLRGVEYERSRASSLLARCEGDSRA